MTNNQPRNRSQRTNQTRTAQPVPIPGEPTTCISDKDRRKLDALAEALGAALNRSASEVYSCVADNPPGFDRSKLDPDYLANSELWDHFCGFALDLACFSPRTSPTAHNSLSDHGPETRGWRTVSLREVARIVVVLFWFTLLLSHGAFAPEIELWRLQETTGRERRAAFRRLWRFLHQAAAPRDDHNPAPALRAAYDIANSLLPGVARNYEKDRAALKQFERRRRKLSPARNVTQKRTQ